MLHVVERDGRVFDRFPSRDQRRGNWLYEEVATPVEPKPVTWYTRLTTDQGREGACVGHSMTVDAIARPMADTKSTTAQANQYAFRHYKRAQDLDPWAGNAYAGTSVDAGFKASREAGILEEWRWLNGLDDVRNAVVSEGPVVLGINWYQEMYRTRPSGLVKIGGAVVGGHAITIIGYHPEMRILGEDWHARFEVFKWKNSWGTGYGKNGVGYVKAEDLRELLRDNGEAAVAMGRKSVNLGRLLAA